MFFENFDPGIRLYTVTNLKWGSSSHKVLPRIHNALVYRVKGKADFHFGDGRTISTGAGEIFYCPANLGYDVEYDDGEIIALINPQFEAGREQVGKKGVVRDIKVHYAVVEKIVKFAEENGFYPAGLSYSPIKGPEGNIEYLIYLKNNGKKREISDEEIKTLVDESHSTL